MQKQDFSNNDNKPKMPKFNMNWLYVMILIALCVTFFTDGGSSLLSGSGSANKVSYSTFKAYVEKEKAELIQKYRLNASDEPPLQEQCRSGPDKTASA